MKMQYCILLFLVFFKTEAQTSVLLVADSLMQTGNYVLALNKLENTLPQTFKILVKQANIYQQTGNYSKAIVFYKKALQKGYAKEIKQALGKSYLLQGNVNQAIVSYEEVLATDSLNLLLQYELAKLYIKEFRKNDAIPLLENLIKNDSLNPGYYYHLGKIYLNKGASGFMKSGNYFLDTYKIDSTHLKSIYELSKFYKKLRFKDSTTLFIDKGLIINPKSINFNQLKAKETYFLKEYKTTLNYLKRLEALNYKTIFTYKLYGMTYMKMEDYENAEKYFKIALRKEFSDASSLYYLGLIYKNKEEFKTARFYFTSSIYSLKPKVDKQYFELGLIALQENNLKLAVSNFKDAYDNNRKNYFALFQLAMASEKYYKDKKIALKYYKSYTEKFSSKDEKMLEYTIKRIKDLKKDFFLKGELID